MKTSENICIFVMVFIISQTVHAKIGQGAQSGSENQSPVSDKNVPPAQTNTTSQPQQTKTSSSRIGQGLGNQDRRLGDGLDVPGQTTNQQKSGFNLDLSSWLIPLFAFVGLSGSKPNASPSGSQSHGSPSRSGFGDAVVVLSEAGGEEPTRR